MKPNGPQGKILQHSMGLGAPDATTVRRRACELAEIDGRKIPSQRDWEEAKRELHGGHDFIQHNGDGGEKMAYSVSESDMVAGTLGHRVENVGPEGTDCIAEELIAEGMDEAVHEQMLESRRRENGEYSEEDSEELE